MKKTLFSVAALLLGGCLSMQAQVSLVNPVPHQVERQAGTAVVEAPKAWAITADAGRHQDVVRLLQQAEGAKAGGAKAAFKLTIGVKGDKAVKKYAKKIPAKAEGYYLEVTPKGAVLAAADEVGLFWAAQTWMAMLSEGKMEYCTITDYPDVPYRGVVEGFYGTPWSHQARLSQIAFYARHKMNVYIYGPKDDPWHRDKWREPYPEAEAKRISELATYARSQGVNFYWAIHPGVDIKWTEQDRDYLVAKLEKMYDLGVRSFAIHFDDIDGEGTNPVKQVDLLNRLTREFVKAKGDVAPLVVCPTDYSQLWANPKPTGSLAIYGNTLDPEINVFWTGEVVCSDLTKASLDFVNTRIKRPAYYWWNFPVTDYARHIIMQGPSYGLDTKLTNKDLCGVLSNPMEHGEASKLALYGVADYNWNIADYNPIDNWERGLVELTPEAADAYRTFAIHSCDTETGYRRIESWETDAFRIGHYTQAQYDALKREFDKIARVPQVMERDCKNQLLLTELRPWLKEFGKLGQRGSRTLELLKLYEAGNHAAFWKGYVANAMSAEDRAAYEAHKMGTMVLQPFYENAMDDMGTGFYKQLTGELPDFYRGIGTYTTLRTTQSKLMLDGNPATYYHSGASQAKGHWAGIDLGRVKEVKEVKVLQGRNSKDDVDYFDNVILEYSADGKAWNALTGELAKTYEVCWKGEPVQARYLRIRKLESKKSNWLAIREFIVNPTTPESVGFKVEATDVEGAMAAFDHNPCTVYSNNGKLGFEVTPGTHSYTLLLKPAGALTATQYDAKGNVVGTQNIDQPFYQLEVAAKAAKVVLEGKTDVFEIIPRS